MTVKNAAAVTPGTSLGATTVPTATVNQEDGANVENAQPTVEVPSKTIYR